MNAAEDSARMGNRSLIVLDPILRVPSKPYRTDQNMHAFFIVHDSELAGFALVESGTEVDPHIIRKFFIMRKFYRGDLEKLRQ